jgi:hypothetical protein
MDLHGLASGGVEFARDWKFGGAELVEKFRSNREKVAAGKLGDLIFAAAGSSHDLCLDPELFVVVVDLGDGLRVSAVYYPVSALLAWLQPVAGSLPTTHVFEGMRIVLQQHIFPWEAFWWSLFLNIAYLILTISIFAFAFEKSRSKGLSRFE